MTLLAVLAHIFGCSIAKDIRRCKKDGQADQNNTHNTPLKHHVQAYNPPIQITLAYFEKN